MFYPQNLALHLKAKPPKRYVSYMAKVKKIYSCSECGYESPKWMGQCRECQAWGTLEESIPLAAASNFQGGKSSPDNPGTVIIGNSIVPTRPDTPAKPISSIDTSPSRYHPTDITELDRVLGGGLVPGAVILLAGEPGVGKSTLLLETAAKIANNPPRINSGKKQPVLYISGEESIAQIKLRAERIGAITDNLLLASQTELEATLGHICSENPSMVIVDSVQTIASTQVEGSAGGVSQIKAVTQALINVAKSKNIPTLLVGHVTKTGGIAGPRVLEHLVDVVCYFEGDRHSRLRLLRAQKNRYGSTDEVGCFEITETGIKSLSDPSGIFLSHTRSSIPGTCVCITLEGRRPLATEVQALVNPVTSGATPRRTTAGLDYSRLAMILAVLQSRMRLSLHTTDVYASTVGGAKISEPAADLALALAVASAAKNQPLSANLVAIGEVSLTGEVRNTVGVQQRLNEAARLGFSTVLVPDYAAQELKTPSGITLKPVTNLAQAVMEAFNS